MVPSMTQSGGAGRWFADTFKGAFDNARTSAKEQFTLDGYEHAAAVVFGVIDQQVEALSAKVRTGGTLSDQEVFLLTALSDLKSEILRELQAEWERVAQPQ
jgi:hypothetical protein